VHDRLTYAFHDSKGGVSAYFQLIFANCSLYLPPATSCVGTAAPTASTSWGSSFTVTDPMFSSRFAILVVPAAQTIQIFQNDVSICYSCASPYNYRVNPKDSTKFMDELWWSEVFCKTFAFPGLWRKFAWLLKFWQYDVRSDVLPSRILCRNKTVDSTFKWHGGLPNAQHTYPV
jgi:hypothetical protein